MMSHHVWNPWTSNPVNSGGKMNDNSEQRRNGKGRKALKLLLCGLILFGMMVVPGGTVLADDWGPKTPTVRLSPASGICGTNIYIGVIDYPKLTQYQVFFASRDNLVATVTTDAAGCAFTSYAVPERPAGQYQVLVTDGTTERSAIFQLEPTCSVSTSRAKVNESMTVSGKCFAGNQKASLFYDDHNIGTASTDANGNLKISAAVPSSPGGIHMLKVIDSSGYTASTRIIVTPSAQLIPDSGPIGTEVQVEAHGFSAESDLVVTTGQTKIAVIPASGNGYYRFVFRVPAIQGVNDIVIADKSDAVNIPFSVSSTLALSSSSGGIPSFVSLQGTGYRGGVPLTVSFDDNKVGTVNTSPQGEFTFNLTVGKASGGNHTVLVTDGENIRKAQFIVETTPPLAPRPAFPKDKELVSGDVTLAWGKVSDPSGVLYRIEVATDKDFKNLIMSRAGLVEQDFMIAADRFNHAAETWYYWRVLAVDGASNQGPWSETRSFHTDFNLMAFILGMPVWTKGGLAAILLAFCCFTCFWAGRMVSVRKEQQVLEYSNEDEPPGA